MWLHQLLTELIVVAAQRNSTTVKARELPATVRPRDIVGKTRRQVAVDLVEDVTALDRKLKGAMGRVGSAGDHAAMESWHALLQSNVLDRRRWRTRDEPHSAVVFWIEHTYNRRRRQRTLGELTPVEYELAFTTQDAAVAA